MKNYILDTHTLLWFLNGDRLLSDNVKKLIEQKENKIYLSIASIWEIAIKISIKKLKHDKGFEHLLHLLKVNEIEILEINTNHLTKVIDLEFIHKDPFDRLIIAQGIIENLTILTKDRHIKNYKVNTIW